ncbi:alpha/beta hydrolase [Cohnella caldifontis]|uniref:alpha/beta hydrolase n=1 Tax=Cohnella caldifontis TaxID=3027471 RepID=UPI0023EB1B99|nr:alpha/beta hydrolase [Cohnella sp. YIM B05605]
MEKTSPEKLAAIKLHLRQSGGYAGKPVERIRLEMAETAITMPAHPGVSIQAETIGSLYGEWIRPADLNANMERRAILYFHGGGFVSGTCAFYRDLGSRIALAGGAKMLIPEYRLAPEFPYPAANEDCLLAYRWLLAHGYAPRDIVFGGDSVGGSLALMTMLALRDHGEPLPSGAFLLSPHADLVHLDGESYRTRAETDPTGSLEASRRILDDYLGAHREEVPLLSPLRMNLEALPGLLIQVGGHEVLLSDAERLADRARAAGVPVELEVWEGMWSVFQFLGGLLPEARQAIANIGGFVQSRLAP